VIYELSKPQNSHPLQLNLGSFFPVALSVIYKELLSLANRFASVVTVHPGRAIMDKNGAGIAIITVIYKAQFVAMQPTIEGSGAGKAVDKTTSDRIPPRPGSALHLVSRGHYTRILSDESSSWQVL